MKYLLLFLLTAFTTSIFAQDASMENAQKAKQYNLVKIGSSAQINIIPYYYEYDIYYDYGDYNNRNYYYEGGNVTLYAGYEHIWEYKNKTALALEPIVGASFYENSTHAFIGNNTKFYWANREFWRMGIAIYTGFSYANHETTRVVSRDGGNYYQSIDIDMHYSLFSTNISLIPFQFRIKNSPVVIESQFAMGGLSILVERSQKYYVNEYDESQIKNVTAFPYLFKGELKIGFVLP